MRDAIKTLLSTAVIFLALRSFAFASYNVPTESMVPTIEVGDRVVVNKAAYGYSRFSLPGGDYLPSWPFGDGRLLGQLPERGDVVVFRHPILGDDWLKRVVALPGDHVRLSEGQLFVNGILAERRADGSYLYREPAGQIVRVRRFVEALPEGRSHIIVKRSDDTPGNNMTEVVVPPGHVFMMGDNRDNSADSRFSALGFVPVENLIGRVEAVMFSLNDCQAEPGLRCPGRRFLTLVK